MAVVGMFVGESLGLLVGEKVSPGSVGALLGTLEGLLLGSLLGLALGGVLGLSEGTKLGASLGL